MGRLKLRIVLVEPEYEINVGYCARVCANFGIHDFWIVKPKARIGRTALMYAKHGDEVLKGARIADSIASATRNCLLVVGTSGITWRNKNALRSPITLSRLGSRLSRVNGTVALLFGREGTGMNEKELKMCDIIAHIPADKNYPVLNISHALAIVLYELMARRGGGSVMRIASREERKALAHAFARLVDEKGRKMRLRNKEKIKLAFKRVIERAMVSDIEMRAIMCVLK